MHEVVKAFGGLDAVHINAADLSPETTGNDTDAVSICLDAFDRTVRTGLRVISLPPTARSSTSTAT
jgi:hypothetical protein